LPATVDRDNLPRQVFAASRLFPDGIGGGGRQQRTLRRRAEAAQHADDQADEAHPERADAIAEEAEEEGG